MRSHRPQPIAAVAAAFLLALTAQAADQNSSDSPPGEILLLDHLERVVKVPTNQMPAWLLPPAAVGVKQQVPTPVQGTSQPREVLQRSQDAAAEGFRRFPSVPPPLAPYLASQDEFGNTTARPGPLFDVFPFEPIIQGGKYWLSGYGFRDSLQQTLSPTLRFQPDFQFVINPAFNSRHDHAMVFQLQLDLAW
jgi:hypothetical protein